ncbi:hypothetical protein LTR85_009177 [Meristemomyces frigidus]|nr:hypothetical protein LTR85_009177 [Meristemomyces frigidus]
MSEEDIDGVPMDISPVETPLPASSPGAAATSPAAAPASSDIKGEDTAPSSPMPAKPTPKKRGTKAKKEDGDDDEESPKKKAKGTPTKDRQRKAPAKAVAGARAIARSYEECSESDKKLIDMRDAGRSWVDIRGEWEKITGDKTGNSTLPNRYARLKSNFTVIKE